MVRLVYQDLGCAEYRAVLSCQESRIAAKQRQNSADVLLFVEHPHVYTLGRGGKEANVLAPEDVPVYRTSRGGDVTYHGPGQLVIYPIIDLRSKLRKDVHRYVRNLEMTIIRTLIDFGLKATRRPPYTGIWIGNKKIAAIGIAVRRCITFHGLALNVNPDLTYFKRIVPCGLAWAEVTSMRKEIGAPQDLGSVKGSFLSHFAEVFGYTEVKHAEDGGWRMEDRDSHSAILYPPLASPAKLETRNSKPGTM